MTSLTSISIEEIMNYLRDNLNKQGYDSFRILGKVFRDSISFDGNNKINKDEFLAGLRDTGVLLPKSFIEVIFLYDFRNLCSIMIKILMDM
jgi:hypothetical protein